MSSKTPAELPEQTPERTLKQAPVQPRNALHGITLEAALNELVARYEWAGLAERIPLRCFSSDPSVRSSLKFLRSTPWAREKVESLYLYMLREIRRESQGGGAAGPSSGVDV